MFRLILQTEIFTVVWHVLSYDRKMCDKLIYVANAYWCAATQYHSMDRVRWQNFFYMMAGTSHVRRPTTVLRMVLPEHRLGLRVKKKGCLPLYSGNKLSGYSCDIFVCKLAIPLYCFRDQPIVHRNMSGSISKSAKKLVLERFFGHLVQYTQCQLL